MKRSLIRWTAASLVAASLGLALGGCGSKDKTTSSSEKASSSKVEKKPKASLNKKLQFLLLKQKKILLLQVRQVTHQLQLKRTRQKIHLQLIKQLFLQDLSVLG